MINLPPNPGLARRLAYGNYVRNRFFNRRTLSPIDSIGQGILVEPFVMDDKPGICLNKLINNTTVEIATNPFFCPICQHTQENATISRSLPCTHKFHIECIDYWLKDNINCPMCRQNF